MGLSKYNHELHQRSKMTDEDECYFFIEATNGSYKDSKSNQLLFNFKKPLEKKEKDEWYYRNKAVERFSELLSNISQLETQHLTIIPAPTSKPRDSKLFNDRIDKTIRLLQKQCPNLTIEYAFDAKEDTQEAHMGGNRDIDFIRENIVWKGFSEDPSSTVVFIDDVLTTGTHFRVCKDMILENDERVKRVIGTFLALYTWKEEVEELIL